MSSGYAPCWADIIKESTVKAACPNEFKVFVDNVKELSDTGLLDYDLTLELSEDHETNENSEDQEAAKTALIRHRYKELQEAFKSKTGLELSVGYTGDEDQGGPYDEVDGLYWAVGNAFQKTQAALEFEKKYRVRIERKAWTHFG